VGRITKGVPITRRVYPMVRTGSSTERRCFRRSPSMAFVHHRDGHDRSRRAAVSALFDVRRPTRHPRASMCGEDARPRYQPPAAAGWKATSRTRTCGCPAITCSARERRLSSLPIPGWAGGRIHHAMRTVGAGPADLLIMICERAVSALYPGRGAGPQNNCVMEMCGRLLDGVSRPFRYMTLANRLGK